MGIGQSIGDDELLAIAAGNPQYVIHADDFDGLRKSLQQILTESCQGKRNGNVLSRQNLTISHSKAVFANDTFSFIAIFNCRFFLWNQFLHFREYHLFTSGYNLRIFVARRNSHFTSGIFDLLMMANTKLNQC